MDEHNPSDLGDLEREVLTLIWDAGQTTADAVREALGRKLKESTVRTVLRRLEDKGYLTHDIEGRTYVYKPAQSREVVTARAVQRVADWFCAGSMKELLVGMVDARALGKTELDKIAARIKRARDGGS